MNTMTEGQLTWHTGSVLPYASLWHTTLRLMHLNALRTQELPFSASGTWDKPRATNMLFNEHTSSGRPAVCIPAFAQALGEPVENFEWSHLGRLPISVRCIILPTARICPECIALGYHSALYSLKALPVCPIHHCSFIEQCVCGRPFSCVLNITQRWNAAPGCPCGKTRFFARETCRRPAMDLADTRPLEALALWLDRMATVSLPLPAYKPTRQRHAELFEGALPTWCRELGIHYPTDLTGADHPSIPTFRCAWTNLCAAPREAPKRASQVSDSPKHTSIWRNTPECTVYRAFERYLRHHVTRHCGVITEEFLALPDPLAMAQKMRSSARVQTAFAELLFTGGMEPWACDRRWPDRGTFANPACHQGSHIRDIGSANIDNSRPNQQGLTERSEWLASQVAAARVLLGWSRAQQIAMLCTQTGIADWTSVGYTYWGTWFTVPPPMQVSWAAAVVGDRQLKVAFWPPIACLDWTLPLPDKASRQRKWADAQAKRRAAIDAACNMCCLTWSVAQEWRVAPAAHPQGNELPKRHKLLGVDGTVYCWLFYCYGQYAARACDLPLQGFGESAREAFNALRKAHLEYRQRYAVPTGSSQRRTNGKTLMSVSTLAEEDFRLHIQRISRKGKFWSKPGVFVERAQIHLGWPPYPNFLPTFNPAWRPLLTSESSP